MSMRRLITGVLSLVIALVGLFVGGRWIVFWQIESALVAQVEKLKDSGLTVRYKSLGVNSQSGSVELSEVVIRWQGEDSLCRSGAVIPRIQVKGIHLIPLLLDHKLVVDSVVAVNPQITHAKRRIQSDQKASSGPAGRESEFLKAIEIQVLQIDCGTLTLINDQCQPQLLAGLGITLDHIAIKDLDRGLPLWNVGAAETSLISITLPTEFYEFTVQKFSYSRAEQFVRIDSILMQPTLGHLEFAQQSGHQIDQIRGTVGRIDMTGVRVSESLPVNLAIHQVDLGFKVSVYRDKRFPGAPRESTLMPREFMHQMPFSLSIDSLTLRTSAVTYEEVPETGGMAGKIEFHAIGGSISNITTDSLGETMMRVSARFMNAGDLDAHFTFPMVRGKSNTVRATLSNFPMSSINSMLLPIANLEIQSGKLQSLQLQFQYNEQESNGELDLRYTDLHVKSIRQNEKRSTNRVVTLLVNTMVQNNMDLSDQKAKRSGTILWKRNPQASLLSYWWKSILSGLRSVYRLDNVLRI